MDDYADNCIYIVENLNFYPEEFGSFEPKVDEDELAKQRESQMKAEEEKKAEEDAAAAEAAKPKSRDKNSRNQSKPNLQGSQAPLSSAEDEEKKEGEKEDEE